MRLPELMLALMLLTWSIYILSYFVTKTNVAIRKRSQESAQDNQIVKSVEENALGFIVIGDYGTGLPSQFKVADALSGFVDDINPKISFVISTGDQIYDHGYVIVEINIICFVMINLIYDCVIRLISPDDPSLYSKFENVRN